jgi:hypothetical protein
VLCFSFSRLSLFLPFRGHRGRNRKKLTTFPPLPPPPPTPSPPHPPSLSTFSLSLRTRTHTHTQNTHTHTHTHTHTQTQAAPPASPPGISRQSSLPPT